MPLEDDYYHFIAFGFNLHNCELRIQLDFKISFEGNSGEVTDQKASMSSPRLVLIYLLRGTKDKNSSYFIFFSIN